MMSTTALENQVIQATFSLQIPGGAFITRKLRAGETLSVGSDATAELRLESPGIAGMHCLLTIEENSVNIKDCYSQSGTYVDEKRIQEVYVASNCMIRVGDIEIDLKILNGRLLPQQAERSVYKTVVCSPSRETAPASIAENESFDSLESNPSEESWKADLLTEQDLETTDRIADLLAQLDEVHIENMILRERIEASPKPAPKTSGIGSEDPFQAELIDLMREEIQALQEELEKRTMADFSLELGQTSSLASEIPDREEVEKLVDRLEVLLAELHQKDEHVQVLQELVLAAESANQAEQEEREQLAKWLGEFEQRFEQLSVEWTVENAHLKQKVASLEDERMLALEALSTDSSGAKNEVLQRMTEKLRAQLLESQSHVETMKTANAELKVSLQQAQHSSSREEEIRLARERAEIARMRHDLEVRKQKLQGRSKNVQDGDVGTESTQQKLREIREEFREGGKQKPGNSLSSRLLSLWGRMK